MVNLTNKLVASVKPPRDKKYIRLWDSNISGFGLRVTDKGVKSFIFEGRQGLSKKTKQVKIGRVGEMSVAEARANAAELSRKFRSGEYEKLAQKRCAAVAIIEVIRPCHSRRRNQKRDDGQ